jgi:signal transduction histidine kinase
MEVVSEYRALRASVLQLWRDTEPSPDVRDVDDLTRFNESIDQSLVKAVSSYTKRVDQARDMFLAILSHDLRNPLNSIAMSAAMLPRIGHPDAESIGFVTQISTNAQVMARMISDLLDYTRTRLGAGMPVEPAPMDLGSLCQELFNEFQSANPGRVIRFYSEGDLRGNWDTDRLRQAISNLLGNAFQHGAPAFPVVLNLKGETLHVSIKVHSGGLPIPRGELSKIFDPLVRGSSEEKQRVNRSGSIGLGLYVAREIAKSHGGRLDVISTAETGTEFTMRFPRQFIVTSGQSILDEDHIRQM